MTDREQATDLILRELSETLPAIDESQFVQLINELMVPGRRVLVMGVGRVLIALKAWVKRLVHLGIDINYVGDESEGPLHKNDLLIVGSSSGESKLPVRIAQIAAETIGASVFYVGCTAGSSVDRLADSRLILKGRTKFATENEYPSQQPMSSLFEQQVFLLGDVLALEIMRRRNWTEERVKQNHANLE
ncbi:sugar isomerase [Collinsella sp. AGMB00827]|uniref:Sugar isomerase n=1 Tax=Collinsella ureilytica TaxID=2869515 RepID=A0ABS7MI88_9ACTN|nr:sugar isomerase [Collinsella urealyticum]MBY4797059.1 sugar isomerase [Collinsella urealyticum]